MNKNQITDHLIANGERLSNVVANRVEVNMKKESIKDINRIIEELNILKYEISRM